jgi:lipopolysaccharide transport system permease protein
MMIYYRVRPGPALWTLPLFLLLLLVTAIGVGLWLSSLNVLYRDIGYITPFLTQFWMFITPIAYPASMVPAKWRLLFALNPMTGVVDGFRWALLDNQASAPGSMLVVSCLIAVALLVSGLFYFRRMERQFADMI